MYYSGRITGPEPSAPGREGALRTLRCTPTPGLSPSKEPTQSPSLCWPSCADGERRLSRAWCLSASMLSCTSPLRNFCRFIHSFSSSVSHGVDASSCANSFKLHRPQWGGADGADDGDDGKVGRKLRLKRVVTAQSHSRAAVGPSAPSACALPTELGAAPCRPWGALMPGGGGMTSPPGPPEPGVEVTELAGPGLLGGAKESRASLGSLRSWGAQHRSCWEGPLTPTPQEPSEKEVLFNRHCAGRGNTGSLERGQPPAFRRFGCVCFVGLFFFPFSSG